MSYHIENIRDGLSLINLYPGIPGFDDFLGAWLYKGEKTFIVDTGPSVTVPDLVNALSALNINKLDYIFLTHIHIDHAGGIGDFSRHFMETPIICHDGGIQHLVDPEKLWEGSVKTLGEVGKAYGRINPTPVERFVPASEFSSADVKAILTPGHAAHHISIIRDPYLFAGEAGGVFLALPDGKIYHRPATPPRFFMDVFIESIDRLLALNPDKICVGHYGIRDNAVAVLKNHREQLFLWKEVISDTMNSASAEKDELVDICIRRLLEKDPLLAEYSKMNPDVRKREYGFLKNSVKGFLGYLGVKG